MRQKDNFDIQSRVLRDIDPAACRRAGLITIPAIIHKLPRLSSRLGHEIYILRKDLSGFGGKGSRCSAGLLSKQAVRGRSCIVHPFGSLRSGTVKAYTAKAIQQSAFSIN